jgi:hypothetical protein
VVSPVRISDTSMVSDVTRHTASRSPDGIWTVTWLPGRVFTHSQAVTAITLAEAAAHLQEEGRTTVVDHRHPLWPHIDNWAHELGLTGPNALVRATDPDIDTAGGPNSDGPRSQPQQQHQAAMSGDGSDASTTVEATPESRLGGRGLASIDWLTEAEDSALAEAGVPTEAVVEFGRRWESEILPDLIRRMGEEADLHTTTDTAAGAGGYAAELAAYQAAKTELDQWADEYGPAGEVTAAEDRLDRAAHELAAKVAAAADVRQQIPASGAAAESDAKSFVDVKIDAIDCYDEKPAVVEVTASAGEFDGIILALTTPERSYESVELTPAGAEQLRGALAVATDHLATAQVHDDAHADVESGDASDEQHTAADPVDQADTMRTAEPADDSDLGPHQAPASQTHARAAEPVDECDDADGW